MHVCAILIESAAIVKIMCVNFVASAIFSVRILHAVIESES